MSERLVERIADVLTEMERAVLNGTWLSKSRGEWAEDIVALLAAPEREEPEEGLADTLRRRFPLAYAVPAPDAGDATEDVLQRGEALATYFAGCLKGKPHPDDAGAFPATICEGDWRNVLGLLTEIRRLREWKQDAEKLLLDAGAAAAAWSEENTRLRRELQTAEGAIVRQDWDVRAVDRLKDCRAHDALKIDGLQKEIARLRAEVDALRATLQGGGDAVAWRWRRPLRVGMSSWFYTENEAEVNTVAYEWGGEVEALGVLPPAAPAEEEG